MHAILAAKLVSCSIAIRSDCHDEGGDILDDVVCRAALSVKQQDATAVMVGVGLK